ncbi:MAG: L-serine ammonia-lyase [Planctomycetota bacterium]|nr:L-serine ammonia-lyase [Planctomycetota bacterium]
MRSLCQLYRIGRGPSSSHTMGPALAAEKFRQRFPAAAGYRITLYGSLAATGRGHLADRAIAEALAPAKVEFIWQPEVTLAYHPNGMDFEALSESGCVLGRWRCFSVGGGEIREEGESPAAEVYDISTLTGLLRWSEQTGQPLWAYAVACEGEALWPHLLAVWRAMREAIERGLQQEGTLPGTLRLARKARSYARKTRLLDAYRQRTGLIATFALAVAEENAAGNVVVTAPTCGASGVVPAVLRYLQEREQCQEEEILRALAVAGLVGNVVKTNASISGAEVGCQGEIGTACAMAAAAAAYLLGGTAPQIEYAAEMALEHHLGLTCDPVAGLVQIPCIERNAYAATRALDCAEYALLSDGRHRVSFDQVVETMRRTGKDLPSLYRETAAGGLAGVIGA